jgi:hypothetical protein
MKAARLNQYPGLKTGRDWHSAYRPYKTSLIALPSFPFAYDDLPDLLVNLSFNWTSTTP